MTLDEKIMMNELRFKKKYGDIVLPTRIVDKGEKLKVKFISYEGNNVAAAITHNCFSDTAVPEPLHIELLPQDGVFVAEIELEFNEAGNTKIELWCGASHKTNYWNGDPYDTWGDVGRIVRQVAVIDNGYSAVIPWIGSNIPVIDKEIHKYDLPGDFWLHVDLSDNWDERSIDGISKIIQGVHMYGDRPVVVFDAKTLVPGRKSESVFELDYETQEKGIRKLIELINKLGVDNPELLACYTPDAQTLKILEKFNVKGLTSLCVWQNWQDNGADGWKINHTGVTNQPYYPADDDFRKNGKKRNIMCFSMGNSSCNRNYSIFAFDGCASNASPGQRYKENRVEHFHVQRFYDAFDSFLAAAKHSDELLTVTLPIEAFRGFADWNAINEFAIRYAVKKASKEKIVFASAADISEYHIRKQIDMQKAYFFQFDNYYGVGNCNMPGHVMDRIEADTPDYLAVIKRGSMRPMFFFDYTDEWNNDSFKMTGRDEFGLVNPDTIDPSDWDPTQAESRDVKFSSCWENNTLIVCAESETPKKRMVTGVFDIPFEKEFLYTVDKQDANVVKVFDTRGENTHLFIDMGALKAGKNEVRVTIEGKKRTPDNYVLNFDMLGIMLFGDHAYLRSLDKDKAVSVKMTAPNDAYILFPSGKKIYSKNGILEFNVNTDWFDECPVLYNYDRALLAKADVATTDLGKTKCKH